LQQCRGGSCASSYAAAAASNKIAKEAKSGPVPGHVVAASKQFDPSTGWGAPFAATIKLTAAAFFNATAGATATAISTAATSTPTAATST
jgi:hypothetical protein